MSAMAIGTNTDEIEAVDILESSDLDVAGTVKVTAIGDLLGDALAALPAEPPSEPSEALSWETPPDAFYHPGGRVRKIGEVTVELAPTPDTTYVGNLRTRRRRLGVVASALFVVPLGILAGAGLVALAAPARAPVAANVAAAKPLAVATPEPARTGDEHAERAATATPAPATESAPVAASEPKATSGTLVGPARKAIRLDGKKLASSSAIVLCGKHVVKVGLGRAQTVDVPCGGELRVK